VRQHLQGAIARSEDEIAVAAVDDDGHAHITGSALGAFGAERGRPRQVAQGGGCRLVGLGGQFRACTIRYL
jgi:hypothetical protein